MISLAHFVLTALHMVQMTLAYFLMLIVMTYNTWLCLSVIFGSTLGNQIYLVTLRPTQLTQASFLQKKSNVAKCFIDICYAEMAQWH